MQFGLRIPPCAPPQEIAADVASAERLGFDYAWIPDSQLLWRDLWVTMAVAGARTSTITLGTNVTNPVTRHITVTASAAAAVDELTGGRIALGIGVGDSSVRVMGRKPANMAQLTEYVAVLRRLWAGEHIAPYGPAVRLKGATGRRIPIYIGASGPKMLELAGEIGDGVIVLAGIARDSLEAALASVERGARRSGRRLDDLDIVTGTFCHISDDRRLAMKLAQPYAALYIARYPGSLKAFGIPEIAAGKTSGVYPDLAHAEDWARAIEVTDWVPDDVLEAFCEKFCLVGTTEDVTAKVRMLASYGVRNLYIRGFYSYEVPRTVAEAFARSVIPASRQQSSVKGPGQA